MERSPTRKRQRQRQSKTQPKTTLPGWEAGGDTQEQGERKKKKKGERIQLNIVSIMVSFFNFAGAPVSIIFGYLAFDSSVRTRLITTGELHQSAGYCFALLAVGIRVIIASLINAARPGTIKLIKI